MLKRALWHLVVVRVGRLSFFVPFPPAPPTPYGHATTAMHDMSAPPPPPPIGHTTMAMDGISTTPLPPLPPSPLGVRRAWLHSAKTATPAVGVSPSHCRVRLSRERVSRRQRAVTLYTNGQITMYYTDHHLGPSPAAMGCCAGSVQCRSNPGNLHCRSCRLYNSQPAALGLCAGASCTRVCAGYRSYYWSRQVFQPPGVFLEKRLQNTRRSRLTVPADLKPPKGFGLGLGSGSGLGLGWSGLTCRVEIDDTRPQQSDAPAHSGSHPAA